MTLRNIDVFSAVLVEHGLVDGDTIAELTEQNAEVSLDGVKIPSEGIAGGQAPLDLDGVSVNLITGVISGVTGSVDQVNRITAQVQKLLDLKRELYTPGTTVASQTGFRLERE